MALNRGDYRTLSEAPRIRPLDLQDRRELGHDLQARIARALLLLAWISGVMPSFFVWLISLRPQLGANQKEIAPDARDCASATHLATRLV